MISQHPYAPRNGPRLGLTALILGLVVILVGGCAGLAVAVEGTPSAVRSAQERAYLAGVADGPDIQWPSTDGEKLNLGWAICQDAPGVTREQMIAKLMTPPKPWPLRPAQIVVDQAKGQLCPTTAWRTVPTLPTLTPQDLAEARDVGPKAGPIKVDGQWHVGTEETDHILPGRYRTNGSSGIPTCYFAKLDPADPDKILSNSLRDGPREVELREGDLFETMHCGTWVKQG
jgi:hypothetical protein